MYSPAIISSRTLKVHQVGRYQAVLRDQIVARGSIGYEFALQVLEKDNPVPVMIITSERNDRAAAAAVFVKMGLDPDMIESPKGSHFLCIFENDTHLNLGESDDWGNEVKFETKALSLMRGRLEKISR